MGIFNISLHNEDSFIEFEEVYNEILNQTDYIITWQNGTKFLMAMDVDAGGLKIKGGAPYDASEIEEQLAGAIDNYNNGFYWI